MKNERWKAAAAAAYVLFSALAIGSVTTAPKLPIMLVVPAAACLFMLRPDRERLKTAAPYPFLMLCGTAALFLFSQIIWIARLAAPEFIRAGFVRTVYNSVITAAGLSAVYIFGTRAVDMLACGTLLMNTARLVRALAIFGPARAAADFAAAFAGKGQTGFMAEMEIQDATYVYGVLVIYYLLAERVPLRRRAFFIAASLFYVVLGFKRIIFLSLSLAAAAALIVRRLPEKRRAGFAMLIGAAVMTAAFLYIPFIKYGLFKALTIRLGINTNSRLGLYDFAAETYDFAPAYMGRGVEYMTELLAENRVSGLKFPGSSLHFLHNDILVRYIELGFWGFAAWLAAVCLIVCRALGRLSGPTAAAAYAVINAYCFVNYSVGNTNRSFAVRFAVTAAVSALCLKSVNCAKYDQIVNASLL